MVFFLSRIKDALLKADQYILTKGSGGTTFCLSKAKTDMEAYTKLTGSGKHALHISFYISYILYILYTVFIYIILYISYILYIFYIYFIFYSETLKKVANMYVNELTTSV